MIHRSNKYILPINKQIIGLLNETTPDIAQKEFFSPDISYTPDMSQK